MENPDLLYMNTIYMSECHDTHALLHSSKMVKCARKTKLISINSGTCGLLSGSKNERSNKTEITNNNYWHHHPHFTHTIHENLIMVARV